MAISAQMIKELREQTGLGMMECKTALDKNSGDSAKALASLKERGLTMAAKKEGRAASQGRIFSYITDYGKSGVMLELNCESDFVANTDVFKELAKNLLNQIFMKDDKETPVIKDLVKQGIAKVGENIILSKTSRFEVASNGRICTYIHFNGKVGVLLELNCASDSAASTDVFQELAKNLCLQVCATNPMVVKSEDLDPQLVAKLREEYMQEVKGKPQEIAVKIAEGKLSKLFFAQKCLMEQIFVKDEKGAMTVKDLIKQTIAKVGENIVVSRFSRFEVGKE